MERKNQTGLRYIGATRPAFSLAELVVSIGILLLMLSLAGQVYTFTIQSTGDATALTEVNQQLRIFEQIIRDDLANAVPERSVMVIQGNPVNAYWTHDCKEADNDADPANGCPHPGDPMREDADGNLLRPRADVLMFFTSRTGRSYTNPDLTANLQQVVYGHAELGEYVPNPGTTGPQDLYQFEPGPQAFPQDDNTAYPSPAAVSPVPAQDWHLARRSVLLLPALPPPRDAGIGPIDFLDDDPLLRAATDFIGEPPIGFTNLQPCGYRSFEQSVLQTMDPTNPDIQATEDRCRSAPPWFLPEIFGDTTQPYAQWKKPFARSRLDPTPPPQFAHRLGHALLPNCASFKVEWALDPRSSFVAGRLDDMKEIIWFDPGDLGDPSDPADDDPLVKLTHLAKVETDVTIKAKLQSLLSGNDVAHADGTDYALVHRFGSDEANTDPDEKWERLAPDGRPNLMVFTGSRPPCITDPTATASESAEDWCPAGQRRDFLASVPDDLFPAALRITVDVYDNERRLDRPIRHVMILPVGK